MAVMEKEKAIKIIKNHAQEIHNLGVKSLFLFGSTIHGDATEESDVDIMIELDKSIAENLTLLDFIRIKRKLSDFLGIEADLVEKGYIHPYIRRKVEAEAIRVL